MATQKYKATLSRSKGRESWCVIFKHPILTDRKGNPGKRVRRGLGTTDDREAQQLVDQLNEIMADETLWTPAAREMADTKYDHRVVAAFFDNLAPAIIDSRPLREEILPLPGKDDLYAKVLLLGTTGAGKTTIVRQMIGTDPKTERFPSISPAKTTICDIEIIMAEGPFSAVITFISRDKIRHFTEECIIRAGLAYLDQEPVKNVAKKFLEHTDQRFRLSYVLGSYQVLSKKIQQDEILEDDDDENDENDTSSLLTEKDRDDLLIKLNHFLNKIVELTDYTSSEILRELEIALPENPKDLEAFQDLFEDHIQRLDSFHSLVDEVIDEIELRFDYLEKGNLKVGKDNWPTLWSYHGEDRQEFIRTISRFSSNYAPNFGRLLTPLVDGMRISGPFRPSWWEDELAPKLILLDGEGLGHTPESALSISTAVTSKYDMADVIMLVDHAAQPMQAAPMMALQDLVSSGHESKLALCFTHFDELKGDNLPDLLSKKEHVLSSVENVISNIGKKLSKTHENALRRAINGHTYFLANIQKELPEGAKRTKAELRSIQDDIITLAWPEFAGKAEPTYDMSNLVLNVQSAVKEFHTQWEARLGFGNLPDIKKEHWARIKALSRRLGVVGLDEYDHLKPVADLISRLQRNLSLFLSQPASWTPPNSSEEVQAESIDIVERAVHKKLHELARDRLFLGKVKEWYHAFAAHRGPGSTVDRAYDILEIYDTAAPVPVHPLTPEAREFLADINSLVKQAITDGGGRVLTN